MKRPDGAFLFIMPPVINLCSILLIAAVYQPFSIHFKFSNHIDKPIQILHTALVKLIQNAAP